MRLTGAILVKVPDDAVIDAIWRCKRGHEQAAAWHTPDGKRVDPAQDWVFEDTEGVDHPVCLRCFIEDYSLERINFTSG